MGLGRGGWGDVLPRTRLKEQQQGTWRPCQHPVTKRESGLRISNSFSGKIAVFILLYSR